MLLIPNIPPTAISADSTFVLDVQLDINDGERKVEVAIPPAYGFKRAFTVTFSPV